MASRLTRFKDKIKSRYHFNVDQVVKRYEDYLCYSLVTTTSFQNIVDGKLNQKRRNLQLLLLLDYVLYSIPKYGFFIHLYFRDEETRKYYQYILADYGEEMGMLGRTFNFCYPVFTVAFLINYSVMRKFEGQGHLEFLTDWLYRIPKKTKAEVEIQEVSEEESDHSYLDNKAKHRLVKQLHYKTIVAKIMARMTNNAVHVYDFAALMLFLYNKRPSLVVTVVAVYHWFTMVLCIEAAANQFYSLFLSYVMTTDYFQELMRGMMRKIDNMKSTGITNTNLTEILDDYDAMMRDFVKYNKVLKPLLRNLVDFYAFGLTAGFFMFTIDTDTWMLAIMVVAAGGYSFSMLVAGVYVSQLCAVTTDLHNNLSSLCARSAGSQRQRLSLNNLFRLKHVIQELGSLETDGQFVIGLRDGEGAATSRKEIFNLTMDTLSNTLMVLDWLQ